MTGGCLKNMRSCDRRGSLRRIGPIVFLAFGACTSAVSQTSVPPPPAYAGMEFVNPIQRQHNVQAQCAGSTVRASWSFDGERAIFTELTFNSAPLLAEDMALVQGWAGEIGGDFFVWIECGWDAASFTMTEAAAAGSASAKRVKFELADGRIRLVRRRM